MSRKLWMAAALALAMIGGAYAQETPSTQPAQQTEQTKTKKAKKHHAKKHKKNTGTPASAPAAIPQQ